jgi:hypothetical protein
VPADGLLERQPRTPDVVGGDELAVREHGADLRIEGVERRPVPGRRGHAALRGRAAVAALELEHDQQRDVPAVGRRPGARLLEAGHQAHAGGLVVQVGDVEDLRAGLPPRGVGQRTEPHALAHERLGVEAALGVGQQVELEPADVLLGELVRDRRVAVGQERVVVARGRDDLVVGGLLWLGQLPVVGVVGADDLDLVEPRRGGGGWGQDGEQCDQEQRRAKQGGEPPEFDDAAQ